MPREILMSQIGGRRDDFDQAVADHIKKLHAFNSQVGKARPTAHPIVESVIKRIQVNGKPDTYVSDYVILDDTPPGEEPHTPTLEEKKLALHRALHFAENEAKYKILPQRKVRLATVKMSTAMSTPEDKRTAEQLEDIASYLHVQKIWQSYDLIAAQAESDIDDLNEDTVDSWQPPTFG